MEITDIRVRMAEPEGKMKAIISVTFDGVFVVHDIKVIEGANGMFVAMPSRKGSDGEYRDVAHPINAQMRKLMHDKIISAYNEACADENKATEDESC